MSILESSFFSASSVPATIDFNHETAALATTGARNSDMIRFRKLLRESVVAALQNESKSERKLQMLPWASKSMIIQYKQKQGLCYNINDKVPDEKK